MKEFLFFLTFYVLFCWPEIGLGLEPPKKGEFCEELSDRLCRDVWNFSHRGNVDYGGEKIFLGTSPKSEMTFAEKFHAEALVSAVNRFPKDIRKKVASLINDLSDHLAQESREKSWMRQLAVLRFQIGSAIEDVVEDRTRKRRPDLKIEQKKEEDRTFEDRYELQKDNLEMQAEMVRAIYANHPNWLRVKEVFSEAKKDILALIDDFPLKKSLRSEMKDKIKRVKLTLPYQDPRLLGASSDCATTEINAFYFARKNKLTVCAGYFNSFQSKGRMYGTIAHEIGHAIDSSTRIFDQYVKSSLASSLKTVSKSKSQLRCKKWNGIKKAQFVAPKKFMKLPKKIQSFNDCLVNRSGLNPLTLETIKRPSEFVSNRQIGNYAGANSFTKLVQPKIFKFEKLIPNEFYQHPEKLSASYDKYVIMENKEGYFDPNIIFLQEYRCLKEENAKLTRSEIFERALVETRKLYALYLQNEFSLNGRESSLLQEFQLSRPSYESWADWIGKKAFTRYLARLPQNQRKNMVYAANAADCKQSGLNSVAPNLVKIEKKYSNEEHPESRTRRLFLFTEYVAKELSCKRGPEILNRDQVCEL